mgnify:CR=1 FL=1
MPTPRRNHTIALITTLVAAVASSATTHENKPERLEWLQDAGFGMFVHWSMDSQLGCVISHSMAGASDDYLERFIHELPKTFNPKHFDADELAVLAKLAGMQYVVLTTKHHSGFCMWDTATTDFSIMHTPYGRDIVAQYVEALRRQGLGVGFYYSPEDFYYLHTHGIMVSRKGPGSDPMEHPDYVEYIRAQVRELMTNYGPVDVVFFDGRGAEPAKELTSLLSDLASAESFDLKTRALSEEALSLAIELFFRERARLGPEPAAALEKFLRAHLTKIATRDLGLTKPPNFDKISRSKKGK